MDADEETAGSDTVRFRQGGEAKGQLPAYRDWEPDGWEGILAEVEA